MATKSKLNKSVVVIDVTDGSMVNHQIELKPEMLSQEGMIIPSTMERMSFRFDKRYVASKIKHDVLSHLNINQNEAIKLIEDAYQAA